MLPESDKVLQEGVALCGIDRWAERGNKRLSPLEYSFYMEGSATVQKWQCNDNVSLDTKWNQLRVAPERNQHIKQLSSGERGWDGNSISIFCSI